MTRSRRASALIVAVVSIATIASPVRADEIWVAPTTQADLGGVGIASNFFWPVTPVGAVRLAWGVPDNLQTFQSAKVVLIPHSPAGPATLNVFVCPAESGDPVIGACVGPFAQAFTGVANQLLEVDVSAAIAPVVGSAGQTNLAVLAYTSPTTTTDHIVGLRFAYDPVPPTGVATLAANTFSGTQTAPAFVGDGSGLANVNAALLDGLDSTGFATAAHGHDVSEVTNAATLGANTFAGTQTAPAFAGDGSALTNLPVPPGVATLGPNTFTGSQTIDTGNLDLDMSTATTGLITKNGARFLHNFGTDNIFVGVRAGNLTMTGPANTASGVDVLVSNSTGSENTAAGTTALFSNTTGSNNTATGTGALYNNVSGNNNTAHGFQALHGNSSGGQNAAVGQSALRQIGGGSSNVALGYDAGFNSMGGSNNIYLGANVLGGAGESNTMYLGKVGTQTKTVIAGVRGTAVTGAEMVVVDADGRLGSTAIVGPGVDSVGSAQVIDDSLTSADLGPASVGPSELAPDSVGPGAVAFNYAGSAGEGGSATNAELLDGLDSTAFALAGAAASLGANTFTATQTIDTGNLDLDMSTATTGLITKNGARFLHNFGTDNIFVGVRAGNLTMTGPANTASGVDVLVSNSTGSENTAAGTTALFSNTTGSNNTATGTGALYNNVSGNNNTAHGFQALHGNSSGGQNAAVGQSALRQIGGGSSNVALGYDAGFNSMGGSNNIYLGANVLGGAGESNTMYLGRVNTQTKTFIAGVRGITTVNPDAITVMIDSAGQLGTVSSSIRFKDDIHDMAGASRRLFQLRPVTFRYTQAYGDGSKPIQFGLIAEEVAEVFPELAVRGADGQVETVHYEKLSVLLLNEVQRERRQREDLERQVEDLLGRVIALEANTSTR